MGTGVLKLLGGESGTGMYGVAQTRTRLLGRRTLNPQAVKQVLSECAIPTSRQNLLQIQYLSPNRMCPVRMRVTPVLDFPPNIVSNSAG